MTSTDKYNSSLHFRHIDEILRRNPLGNHNIQWTETLYQNNLKHAAFFFTFFKG